MSVLKNLITGLMLSGVVMSGVVAAADTPFEDSLPQDLRQQYETKKLDIDYQYNLQDCFKQNVAMFSECVKKSFSKRGFVIAKPTGKHFMTEKQYKLFSENTNLDYRSAYLFCVSRVNYEGSKEDCDKLSRERAAEQAKTRKLIKNIW